MGRIRTGCLNSNRCRRRSLWARAGASRMVARSPHEAHRAATPLELFFDLVFVVAIAQAASGLHHAVAELHVVDGLIGYLMVFFAIWWAWMAFTWFASAYDCDDVPYRLLVFVQIAGALLLAAGITAMFETRTPNIADGGWLRGHAARARRAVASRVGVGSRTPLDGAAIRGRHRGPADCLGRDALRAAGTGCRGFWCWLRWMLSVPMWAERPSPTTWHPHHITERYGLLTLIVLGESILSANDGDSVGACGRRRAVRAGADHHRRPAHRVFDVVGLLRSARSRFADEYSEGVRLGIRPLLRLRVGGGGWCRARGGRRCGDSHGEGRAGRRRDGGGSARCDISRLSLGPARSAGVSPDASVRSDRGGARAADAIHWLRRAADRGDPCRARWVEVVHLSTSRSRRRSLIGLVHSLGLRSTVPSSLVSA